jgi:RNA polymerase sigma factor (TIGR02999 family)
MDSQHDRPAPTNPFNLDELAAVYAELRPLAASLLRGERRGHTLQTTALVNETLVRLMGKDWKSRAWEDERHFFRVFAAAAREVLIDHARRRSASKRGGGNKRLPLNDVLGMAREAPESLVEIDDLIETLGKSPEFDDPKTAADIARLWLYANLTDEEIAHVIGLTRSGAWRLRMKVKEWLAARCAPATPGEEQSDE